MSPSPEVFERDGLVLEVHRWGREVSVTWRGISDARDPSAFAGQVLRDLGNQPDVDSIELDFRKLEFMNSATLTPIMALIRTLDSKGVRAILRFDAMIDWQRINYNCMKAIARTLSSLRVEGQ
ncbi:MAG: hypothetical protein HOW73_27630 [Polyangiaceae bacterium]|nr:hypothetical protein [Polyangiaceae bacterium]